MIPQNLVGEAVVEPRATDQQLLFRFARLAMRKAAFVSHVTPVLTTQFEGAPHQFATELTAAYIVAYSYAGLLNLRLQQTAETLRPADPNLALVSNLLDVTHRDYTAVDAILSRVAPDTLQQNYLSLVKT